MPEIITRGEVRARGLHTGGLPVAVAADRLVNMVSAAHRLEKPS